MRALEIMSYVLSLIFLALFLITDYIGFAVVTLMYTVYSTEFSIKAFIEKGRE